MFGWLWRTSTVSKTGEGVIYAPYAFSNEPAAARHIKRDQGATAARVFLKENNRNRNVLRLGGPDAPEVLPGGRRRHKEQSAVLAKRARLEAEEKAFRAKHTRTDSTAPMAKAPGERPARHVYRHIY